MSEFAVKGHPSDDKNIKLIPAERQAGLLLNMYKYDKITKFPCKQKIIDFSQMDRLAVVWFK